MQKKYVLLRFVARFLPIQISSLMTIINSFRIAATLSTTNKKLALTVKCFLYDFFYKNN